MVQLVMPPATYTHSMRATLPQRWFDINKEVQKMEDKVLVATTYVFQCEKHET
jgi:hypothetical protein